jgi:hypothetical protein
MNPKRQTMKKMTIGAAVLALGLAQALSGSAWAQDDTQTNTAAGKTGRVSVSGIGSDTGALPAEWDGEIGDALFLDTGAGTLRPEPEFRENFARLSPEQQAAVRDHCAKSDTRSGEGSDAAASGSSSGASPSRNQADTADTGGTAGQGATASDAGATAATAGSGAAPVEPDVPHGPLIRLCEWVASIR